MSEEITALGSSLLNRVSEGRRQVQRDLRRQQNIELGLRIASGGVRAYNNYLNRKGDAALNTEEVQGQSALIRKAIEDAEKIKNDDVAARDFPGGEVNWLAQNKFAPVILENLQRNFDTEGYSDSDITNWVNTKAREEAQRFLPTWRNSVDSAYRIAESDIQDFNDYIRANDGVADNVGGLLFNKAFNAITGKTQTDIDTEIVDAIRNNRFANNARRLQTFNSALRAGINVQGSKDFAYSLRDPESDQPINLSSFGIRRDTEVPFVITSVEPVKESYKKGNRTYEIWVNKVVGTRGGITETRIEPRTRSTVDAEGNTVLVNTDNNYTEFFNHYNGVKDGADIVSNSSIFSASSQEGTEGQPNWVQLAEEGVVRLEPSERIEGPTITKGPWGNKFKTYQIPVYENIVGVEGPPVGFVPQEIAIDTVEGELAQLEAVSTTMRGDIGSRLREIANSTNTGNGENVGDLNLVERHQLGSAFERWEDGDYDTQANQSMDSLFGRLGRRAILLEEATGVEQSEAIDLVLAAYVGSIAQGWDEDAEVVNTRFGIDYETAPNASAIVGIGYATADSTGDIANRIEQRGMTSYLPIAVNAIQEIDALIKSNRGVKGRNIATEIVNNAPVFSELIIPLDGIEDTPTQDLLKATFPNREQYAFTDVVSAIAGLVTPEVPRPPAPAPEPSVERGQPRNFESLVEDVINQDRMTDAERREISGRLLDRITSFLSYTGVEPPERPIDSGVTPEQLEQALSSLTEEQRREFNRLLEGQEDPK